MAHSGPFYVASCTLSPAVWLCLAISASRFIALEVDFGQVDPAGIKNVFLL